NGDTSARVVVCPLPTDNTMVSFGTVTQGVVTVYDRSSTLHLGCTLEAVNDAGGIAWAQTQFTSGPASGAQTLPTFTPSNRSVLDNWVLICTVPGLDNGQYSHIVAITLVAQF